MFSIAQEFSILKAFNITCHASQAPRIKEVKWSMPPCYWIKCNSDGASKGNSGWSACGRIFRDYRDAALGCYAENHGVSNSFHAELVGAMLAVEYAYAKGWFNLWLEYDSQLVVNAINDSLVVPWKIKNRWNNCIGLTESMNFVFYHIFREGNSCADKLASQGLHIQGSIWWDTIAIFIREDFFRNRMSVTPRFS